MADRTTERIARRRAGIGGELALALLPTVTILIVLAFVENFSRQRLLFASLASSAFLVYLDPRHATNQLSTLVLSQGGAALVGAAAFAAFGPSYLSAATAMLVVIALMVVLDRVHPPAVSTTLGFAFRTGAESNLALFGLALTLVGILVVLQRASLWVLARVSTEDQ